MKRALFILILAAAVMGGCITDSNDDNGGDKPSIVGLWETTSGRDATFRADGTYNADAWNIGNYTISGDKLTLVQSDASKKTHNLTFFLTGDFLTIKTDNDPPLYYDYIRVKQ